MFVYVLLRSRYRTTYIMEIFSDKEEATKRMESKIEEAKRDEFGSSPVYTIQTWKVTP